MWKQLLKITLLMVYLMPQYMIYIEVRTITMVSPCTLLVVELHRTPQSKHVMHSDVMTVLPDHVDHVSRSRVVVETEQQQARGSFTSQYVANHLQDLIASPSGVL